MNILIPRFPSFSHDLPKNPPALVPVVGRRRTVKKVGRVAKKGERKGPGAKKRNPIQPGPRDLLRPWNSPERDIPDSRRRAWIILGPLLTRAAPEKPASVIGIKSPSLRATSLLHRAVPAFFLAFYPPPPPPKEFPAEVSGRGLGSRFSVPTGMIDRRTAGVEK